MSTTEVSPGSRTARPHPDRARTGWIPVVLFLISAAIFGYPVIGSLYNDYTHARFTHQYNQATAAADPSELSTALSNAEDYNSGISGIPILDPWLSEVRHDEEYLAYLNYLSQLAETDVMATVDIPSINVNLPIYHGTEESTLSKGVGHLYGTDLPVGGTSRHSVLTAHTGLATATLFNDLDELEIGDIFTINVYGRSLTYQVREINVVDPHDVSLLQRAEGDDLVTLLTCTPYGVNSHRLLVTGERIELPEGEVADEGSSFSIFDSLTGLLLLCAVLALVFLAAALYFFIAWRRQVKETEPAPED